MKSDIRFGLTSLKIKDIHEKLVLGLIFLI